jgi:hypothetical protein
VTTGSGLLTGGAIGMGLGAGCGLAGVAVRVIAAHPRTLSPNQAAVLKMDAQELGTMVKNEHADAYKLFMGGSLLGLLGACAFGVGLLGPEVGKLTTQWRSSG